MCSIRLAPKIRDVSGVDPDASLGRACEHRWHAGSRSTASRHSAAPRKLYRSSDGRWLGGVARGLAGHLGLPVTWVRLVFAGLFLADGLGALVYAAFWFFVPLGVGGVDNQRPPAIATEISPDGRRKLVARKPDRGQIVALLLMVVVAMVFVGNVNLGEGARAYLWPTVLVAAGVALVWRQADNARRARWAEVGRRRRTITLLRSVAGVLLVTAGVSGIFVLQGSAAHLGSVLQAALAVLVGIALLAGPYLVRMTQDLSEERLMRIRAQERAEVAAHVHDSVLHTLTLIQRNADNPNEVRRLARAQERDLRNWLYKPEGTGRTRTTSPTPSPRPSGGTRPRSRTSTASPSRWSSSATAPSTRD